MFRNWTRALIAAVACLSLAFWGQSPAWRALPAFASAQPLTRSVSPRTTNPLNPYIPNTRGRIGLSVIFDGPPANYSIPPSQATADAGRFDVIWGSTRPSAWLAGSNRKLVAGAFFIPEADVLSVGGHSLAWWQTNHPDWILYACDGNNQPTHKPAYVYDFETSVPLDFHNPAVISYQIRQLLAPYAIANGYNAVSIDQVVWADPISTSLGRGYYSCGTWSNNVFTRRYSGIFDPRWSTDTVNWVKAARTILKTDPLIAPHNLAFLVNHPAGSIYNPNETALLANVDVMADESGFSQFGYYQQPAWAGIFKITLDWMLYAQKIGTAVIMIDVYHQDWGTNPTPTHLEYGIATYMMGNEQAADLFVGPATGCCSPGIPDMAYGTEQYHQEYQAPIGTPCAEYYRDSNTLSPHIYYRKYTGGLAVVNSGSLPRAYENAHLPTGKNYIDLENRPISPTMKVNSNDAYVLLTRSNGCS